ncbi:MAG: hypothetical protein V4585_08680 [Bacteroidota bacterium]
MMTNKIPRYFKYLTFLVGCLSIIWLNSCSKKYYPPNTKNLTYDKFIDVSFIENIHVLEFLQYLEADTTSQELYERIKPKTAQNIDGDINIKYLHEYTDRSVPTPMSIEFAQEYCKWRSEIVTYSKNFGNKNMPKSFPDLIKKNKTATTVIKFTIPTKLSLHIADETRIQFKRYDKKLLKFKVINQETSDSTQFYLLRCTATIIINGKISASD